MRDSRPKEKPSTSELLDWLKLLMNEDIDPELREQDAGKMIPPLHGALIKTSKMCISRLACASRAQLVRLNGSEPYVRVLFHKLKSANVLLCGISLA